MHFQFIELDAGGTESACSKVAAAFGRSLATGSGMVESGGPFLSASWFFCSRLSIMKISIITICYNSARYLVHTIESVVSQTYGGLEYIVVDGGSSDGTLDIIRQYEDRIDRWISGPDNGIADAMNKGLAMASGEYVLFLHSDDYLASPEVIAAAVGRMGAGQDVCLFDIFLEKNGQKRLHRPRGFNWWMNLKTGVFHQSAICRRDLFDRIGNFDTSFAIAMDYDFFLRAYRAGASAEKIPLVLSVMRLVGVSSRLDWPELMERFSEEQRTHFKNCTSVWLRVVYMGYWSVYPLYRRMMV